MWTAQTTVCATAQVHRLLVEQAKALDLLVAAGVALPKHDEDEESKDTGAVLEAKEDDADVVSEAEEEDMYIHSMI